MEWKKSRIENPSKSEVIGRCGIDEKNEWPRRTDREKTQQPLNLQICPDIQFTCIKRLS